MGKSILAIHKEIEKKAYAESPLGQKERALTKFYDDLILQGLNLTPEQKAQINEIRTANEQKYMAFVEKTTEEDKAKNAERAKVVDTMLLESFTQELELLNSFNLQSMTPSNSD